ncbi:uncharacterized protein LOC114309754 isoform X1 [Camellia sinensis]|uniref:uncharacterized protein LOC114309754 isoform X1 n=1 Tax=Camellia sinensis TaxID=4442 RepID=UPI001035CF68|nr:uncharacterized protein LOC114309754 isoform X1 [Camellia sinensis]
MELLLPYSSHHCWHCCCHIVVEISHPKLCSCCCKSCSYIGNHQKKDGSNEQPQLIYLQPPKEGWLKLNFDGGTYPNKEVPQEVNALRAGTFRNHKGICVYAFAGTIPMKSAKYAEASTLYRGLQIVAENEWPKIWAEGDAKFLIETILHNTQRDYCSTIWKLIGNTQRRRHNFEDCKITFIRRKCNFTIDALCKHIKRKYGNFKYNDKVLPCKIKNIVHQERQGCIYTYYT